MFKECDGETEEECILDKRGNQLSVLREAMEEDITYQKTVDEGNVK